MDEHITGSITHFDTLIVVNNDIVSESFNVGKGGYLSVLCDTINICTDVLDGSASGSRVNHDQFFPVSEIICDFDVVEGSGRSGEGETRILFKEKGKRERQKCSSDARSNTHWGSIGACHTDHITVTKSFVCGAPPFKVIIQPKVVKLLNNQIIEFDLNMSDEIVHQIVDPSYSRVAGHRALETNRRELGSKEC